MICGSAKTGNGMIIDTSILIAVFFNEDRGPLAAELLEKHRDDLKMSTVNLSEVLILVEDRQPQSFDKISSELLSSSICFMEPSVEDACVAAKARLKYPLNLGDCFAYALAKRENDTLLSFDKDFRKTDIKVLNPSQTDS